jgi:hypothetical protein
VWLIGWDNYFVAQFLGLKDQRGREKEKKIAKHMNLQK